MIDSFTKKNINKKLYCHDRNAEPVLKKNYKWKQETMIDKSPLNYELQFF